MEGATCNACKQIYQGCYFQYHFFDNIVDHVKLQKKPRAGWKNFKKRINHASASMGAVEHVKDMENCLLHYGFIWTDGRQVFASLRNQHTFFTYTLHGGMLRGRWEFSSQRITIWWVWNQVPTRRWSTQVLYCNHEDGNEMSKTNNSVKLFGRVGRHIDPSMCSFGTQWFWLM